MRAPERRKESLIIAVALTALAIVFSQFFYFQLPDTSKKEIKTEQQEDHPENKVYISLPSSSLPSSTHLELNQPMFFLFEILFEKEESVERGFTVFLPPNRFFKTLFEGVISPNAP